MKRLLQAVSIVCLALVLVATPLILVHALPARFASPPAAALNFNLSLILTIVSSLVGLPALWAFLIDVLKWAGVVTDGTAGQWSAAFNALTLILVAVAVTFFPQIQIGSVDAALVDIVIFAGLVFSYVVQIFMTKQVHARLLSKITAFSHSKQWLSAYRSPAPK